MSAYQCRNQQCKQPLTDQVSRASSSRVGLREAADAKEPPRKVHVTCPSCGTVNVFTVRG